MSWSPSQEGIQQILTLVSDLRRPGLTQQQQKEASGRPRYLRCSAQCNALASNSHPIDLSDISLYLPRWTWLTSAPAFVAAPSRRPTPASSRSRRTRTTMGTSPSCSPALRCVLGVWTFYQLRARRAAAKRAQHTDGAIASQNPGSIRSSARDSPVAKLDRFTAQLSSFSASDLLRATRAVVFTAASRRESSA